MEAEQEGALAVLIAVGDASLREMLDSSLQAEGYSTLLAADGETALTFAQKHPLLLVLLDFTLPQRDGLEMCRMLRMQPETAYIPILMIAAHPNAQHSVKAVGADAFLAKPFDIDELLAKLPPEKRLEGLSPEERLEGLSPKERLEGLSAEELRQTLEAARRRLQANGPSSTPE